MERHGSLVKNGSEWSHGWVLYTQQTEVNGPAVAAKAGPGTEQLQWHTVLCVPAVQPACPYKEATVTP